MSTIAQNPLNLTQQHLLEADSAERPALVEAWLLASIAELRADAAGIAADTQLADIGIDSVQIVELKFGLDQLIGTELDVELIINNPTIAELAAGSVRAGGL